MLLRNVARLSHRMMPIGIIHANNNIQHRPISMFMVEGFLFADSERKTPIVRQNPPTKVNISNSVERYITNICARVDNIVAYHPTPAMHTYHHMTDMINTIMLDINKNICSRLEDGTYKFDRYGNRLERYSPDYCLLFNCQGGKIFSRFEINDMVGLNILVNRHDYNDMIKSISIRLSSNKNPLISAYMNNKTITHIYNEKDHVEYVYNKNHPFHPIKCFLRIGSINREYTMDPKTWNPTREIL